MVSTNVGLTTPTGLDPERVREERDQLIAALYVRKGQTRAAVREIAEETGVHLRTVYRAIQRKLAWAIENEKAPDSPPQS